jgi:hypothetical protein
MIKHILTVGDSFTHGDELADRTNAWPYVLAKRLEANVNNRGDPGCGNWRMVRWVIESAKDADLVIIAWSSFLRQEFADASGDYIVWPGAQSKWYTQYSHNRFELIKYITIHNNEEYLYRQYLNYIILIQNYLNQQNKKYIMLDAFENHQHQGRTRNKDLIDQIDTKYFLGWPNESMAEWTYSKGVEQGPFGHFLERGHEIVAEKINEYIRHLGWIS